MAGSVFSQLLGKVLDESPEATQTFGELEVGRRIITTKLRTIAIANISNISVGRVRRRLLRWLLAAIVCVIAGLAVRAIWQDTYQTIGLALYAAGLVSVLLFFLAPRRTHYLLITTNDGVLSRFTGPQPDLLQEVRRVLSEKIDTGNENINLHINFSTGSIENLNVAHADTISQSTHVAGTGHTVATNGATAVSGHAATTVQTAPGANGRVATADTAYSANRSAGAQQANANQQNGTAHINSEQYVDFSQFLPAVVEMHRFYARQPNAEHLEQRLHELELLMRAGAPGGHQKSRVRELTGEVSQILQAYPSAVQIFQNISGLMG